MPKYTLTYFPIRARAQVARVLLFLADQPFEEKTIEFKDWPEEKTKQPFGVLPILETDGLVLSQSGAICRYLASKFGLAGSTPEDAARADMIGSCTEDMVITYTRTRFHSKTEEDKEEGYKQFREKTLPDYASKFDAMLKKYKNGDSFFVVDSITWADVSVYHWFKWFESPDVASVDLSALVKPYPKLEAFFKRMESDPKFAAYLKANPMTGR